MAVTVSSNLSRPMPACIQRQSVRNIPTGTTVLHIPHSYTKLRLVLRKSLAQQQSPTESLDVKRLVDFLYDDLPHLFDEQGIDRSMYDERVQFRDPITKHDTIDGYLFNIKMLKVLFQPDFLLHSVKQTGPYEITTRWTMVMKFVLLPWKPELVFTGVSIMGINPRTQKFCSHVDIWDSIDNNEYFSLEGLVDVLKQLRIYKTPDLDTPKYQILKRTANYEVRKYAPFLVVESKGDKLSGSSGFNNITGYIFGKNSSSEKIPMTTPVFTQASDDNLSDVSIQIVLPLDKDFNSLPAPSVEEVKIRKAEGGIAAVKKFSGKPTEEVVRSKEKELRMALLKDGLNSEKGCLLARYNDPRTSAFVMRNEVLIWLNDFTLE
ncbi:SOUL heme-binding family protein [Rhynchospora pubera]|uniref:SOUL heme-binding family protein n=1 Tax=Rhynchospora pubera TaxID=906938 RepID=A0AAV8FC75_9POAL|nr:SOUL heme-binding family protein [Rhynchospora pubera]